MSSQPNAAAPGGAAEESEMQPDASTPPPAPAADGLHFFSHTVDGQWRGGWFRVRDGHLEVYAAGQIRMISLTESRDPASLLQKMLTEMVRLRH